MGYSSEAEVSPRDYFQPVSLMLKKIISLYFKLDLALKKNAESIPKF